MQNTGRQQEISELVDGDTPPLTFPSHTQTQTHPLQTQG